MHKMSARKIMLTVGLACGVSLVAGSALAAEKIKFTLDWKYEGPAGAFLLAQDKGYFADEGIDVTIDTGNGSAGAVTRVASGAYDIAFADLNSLVEFDVKNPDRALKSFFVVYNEPPFALFMLKKSGIKTPKDLEGKTLGAPVFDSPRKLFPAFAKATGIDPAKIKWESMDPPLREPMLARGQVDVISGFYFTSLLNLENIGVKPEDLTIFNYVDYGMAFYGNGLIASPALTKDKPALLKGFARAVAKGFRDAIKDPKAAIASLKKRDPLINPDLELKRLELALKVSVLTPEAKENGMGPIKKDRMAKAIDQLVLAFQLPKTPAVDDVFTDVAMPDKADRMLQ